MRSRFVLSLIAIAFSLVSCTGGKEPIASVRVTPTTLVLRHGQCAPLKFDWKPVLPLEKRDGTPRVFVHLLDGPHQLVRTFDHPLPFQWTPGRAESYEIDLCHSAIAPPLAAGAHVLKIGIYDDMIGYRWPLSVSGVETGNRSYQVAGVSVPASGGSVPRFAFDGGWQPPETAGDKQIVARRPFRSGATLALTGISEPGILKLIVRPSAQSGALTIESCGSPPMTFTEPRPHSVDIPITAATGGTCQLRFTLTGTGTATLEMLGWEFAGR